MPGASKPTNSSMEGSESRVDANNSRSKPSQSRKRRSENTRSPPKPRQTKRAKTSSVEASDTPKADTRPRLTTPDLEFDFDRTQLRDQRPTPGRINRPRLTHGELDDEFKERFYIPEVSKSSKASFAKQALADPSYTFHDLHVCHKKGPNGSPTYDEAGFQLDWCKVDKWMKPTSYSKSRAVNGMNRALERAAKEEKTMYDAFFVDGKGPDNTSSCQVTNYIKDHVSKDLHVPWHQIDAKRVSEWEKKGFPQQKADEWWREPNEEEKKRMLKMMTGASLRKDL